MAMSAATENIRLHYSFLPKRRKLTRFTMEAHSMASLPLAIASDRASNSMSLKKSSLLLNSIPTEIFHQIAGYLPRSSVKNMRLVNHEFEEKVSALFFRTVVVPFRPEIYGITECTGEVSKVVPGPAVMLQDKGMRVFQGFGKHIRRFAMSFEVDYAALSMPPSKANQKAVTTFWGIYRWPFPWYNRYTQLEDLEQTADETHSMAEAFKYISKVRELGLSMDGGLGWLHGPDHNPEDKNPYKKVPVFGTSTFPEEETEPNSNVSAKLLPMPNSPQSDNMTNGYITDIRDQTLRSMLSEAGYRGEELEKALRTFLNSERSAYSEELKMSPWPDPVDESSSSEQIESALPQPNSILPARPTRHNGRPPRFGGATRPYDDDAEGISLNSTESGGRFPLLGDNLTDAQKEILLEVGWAQQAFIHSYTISIIDNPAAFLNVTKFTISQLPSKYLKLLKRDDIWLSLPQLRELLLAVIPEWRQVSKLSTGSVKDVPIDPSCAVTRVFFLLKQVGRNRSIKTLHFEWICGGEEAMGRFARNRWILAAPLVQEAADMITSGDPNSLTPILNLPHVRQLSLKNCWISPHILSRFVKILGKQKLKELSLTSISLCAHCPPGSRVRGPRSSYANIPQQPQQPAPQQQPAQLNNIQMPIHTGPPAAQGVPPGLQPLPDWLDEPIRGSWPAIIDTITPGITLAEHRYAYNPAIQPPLREKVSLKKITFDSCGYVRLPIELDQRLFRLSAIDGMPKRGREIESYMMKTTDLLVGLIVNNLPQRDSLILQQAWDMREGWDPVDRARQINLAKADGFPQPGRGRFRGVLENTVDSTLAAEV